jgi:hypothetical protein
VTTPTATMGRSATGAQTGLPQQDRLYRAVALRPPHCGAECRPERADLYSMQRWCRTRRAAKIKRSARISPVNDHMIDHCA